VVIENTQPGAVRVPPALRRETVGSIQQPEGGGDDVGPGVKSEESTHISAGQLDGQLRCHQRASPVAARPVIKGRSKKL
jgi:hypothetical protein